MRFLTALIILLCLAGATVSSLAVREHYNTEPSPCKINERWDCGTVNHSPYAVLGTYPKIGEITVALIGILGYTLLAVMAGRAPLLTFVAALIGFGFALRLTYIEWRVLMVWCLYCVTSQVIIACILVVSGIALGLSRRRPSRARV